MSARMLDGRALSKEIRAGLFERSLRIRNKGVVPGLAVILVGNDPASKVYVRNKSKACDECGVMSKIFSFPGTVSEYELMELIAELNVSNEIDGILVQLPLPGHVNVRNIIGCISVNKDVDGFHLYNVGGLVVGGTIFPPCTPYGVQLLLEAAKIEVASKNVVIVGASNIVGKPMALMLLQKGATVSICHIKTRDLSLYTRMADILIVAAGKPGLITADMVKNDVVVIDVGINKMSDGSITGDVDFDSVKHIASWITPVPGGVGPMTVTMLIENTIRSAELRMSINQL
ncbi:bifunctional methylenetetrahydrofolate dehydrogenase/methenyltetrahydrofolate cyclohydrolase FolD [Acidithiobacillus ferrianus]|uniref:Bifunctional protein FolD n=2 Tax=Acidithiobacillus ferrianus TaxID=2678518 RepID=A0A845UH03_9PROT|nr:bifunctional methylenetetrahydrofolate dehydrogenase/methenyltetrahydrofolate cyclohydrolase FolD [Acidithiobacillus ferrianus]NDU43134.1 bifunctional methylenetetrahydrofolate dehydrogenase/methenyltetrahydrofolate cyclohydrolase FolD [Acidithiobacillus ferrianus]